MSVDYSTKLGYGFKVTKDEYLSLSKEKLNEFQEDNYTLALNNWAFNITDYFFGLDLKSVGPGEMTTLDFTYKYPDGTLEEFKNRYHYYFPNSTTECNYWILSCID